MTDLGIVQAADDADELRADSADFQKLREALCAAWMTANSSSIRLTKTGFDKSAHMFWHLAGEVNGLIERLDEMEG